MKTYRYILIFIAALLLGTGAYAQGNEGLAWASCPKALRNSEQIVEHSGYAVSYNTVTLCPNWVAWELASDETWGETSRTDEFTQDPSVASWRQAESRDYTRSGYDRGHMAPAADMRWSVESMVESFYMTNVCPQDNGLNAGMWLTLEKKCRGWAKRYGRVWIVCGPIFTNVEPLGQIGEAGVWVPRSFYKVVLREYKPGKYDCRSFVMPNRNITGETADYIRSLREVESLTGITFFPALDSTVKAAICDEKDAKYWN